MNVFTNYIEDYIEKRIERWLAKDGITNADLVKSTAEKFKRYRNRFALDINAFNSLQQLQNKLNEIESGELETKSAVKKKIRAGIPGLAENVDYKAIKLPKTAAEGVEVYAPLTHKGSATIGRASRWCTAMENDDNHWKSYTGRGVMFFYLLNPLSKNDNNKMFAFAFEQNRASIFNKADHQVNEKDYDKAGTGVPVSFLKGLIAKIEAQRNKAFLDAIRNAKTKNQVVTAFAGLQDRKYISTDSREGISVDDIDDDLSLKYSGGITVEKLFEGKIPVRFKSTAKHFIIQDSNLITLQNCPQIVGGDFACIETKISSLEGGPQKVGGNFNANSCKSLTSLIGGPEIVGGDYDVGDTNLENTNGIAKAIGQSLYLNVTDDLTITEIPEVISGDLYLQESTKNNKNKVKEVAVIFKKVLKGEIYEY
jgi:hypothetical protein